MILTQNNRWWDESIFKRVVLRLQTTGREIA